MMYTWNFNAPRHIGIVIVQFDFRLGSNLLFDGFGLGQVVEISWLSLMY